MLQNSSWVRLFSSRILLTFCPTSLRISMHRRKGITKYKFTNYSMYYTAWSAGRSPPVSGKPNVDDPVARLQDIRRLQEDVFGYRACFFILLGLVVIWGVALMVNRTPPLHLNACEALKYYLGALDEASTKLPMEKCPRTSLRTSRLTQPVRLRSTSSCPRPT